ncbi:hypothetical protein E2562_039173 [Oryza meyeriana var. granulata]|uniref:Peptidase S8/S53 domain-containing protein n=1 Tax=Oryza meyeriana var. granulata TaxID=110450 RepID=A0A6G1DT95_9ORYZ|nr:hypothetical protein E2562_039173 [Oryza meyeriana var. granulata]
MALADGVDILSRPRSQPSRGASSSAPRPATMARYRGRSPTTRNGILTVGASSQRSPHSTTIPAFSSRGPSRKNGGVLKPDIVGPGVDILAAVPLSAHGASFASHVHVNAAPQRNSSIAKKSASDGPTWSAAAITTVITTTADASDIHGTPLTDEAGRPASYFAMGAGQVNPAKAIDPGLVYDISPEEYIPYLCGVYYTNDQVNRIIYPAPAVNCAEMEKTPSRKT